MKSCGLIILSLFISSVISVRADIIFDLYGSQGNPSDLALLLDDETGPIPYTIDTFTATFSTPDGTMNRTDSGFGINGSGSDVTYAIDSSDALLVSFDRDVQITALDFRNFESGESIDVTIGSITHTITYDDLTNKSSDYVLNLNWNVSRYDSIRIEASGPSSAVALDSVAVVPEPGTISLLFSGGMVMLFARRRFG